MTEDTIKRRAKGLDRAFDILDFLKEIGQPLRPNDIASGIGSPKSTVYELVASLLERRILETVGKDGHVYLGRQLYFLGQAHLRHFDLTRVAIPYNMEIDDAIKLMRDVGQKMRSDPLQRRNIWSPLEIQGVESFESGSAVLRARFKTAPIKQWEVSRAFNLSLKRHLDAAGLDLATPRMSIQVITGAGGAEKE